MDLEITNKEIINYTFNNSIKSWYKFVTTWVGVVYVMLMKIKCLHSRITWFKWVIICTSTLSWIIHEFLSCIYFVKYIEMNGSWLVWSRARYICVCVFVYYNFLIIKWLLVTCIRSTISNLAPLRGIFFSVVQFIIFICFSMVRVGVMKKLASFCTGGTWIKRSSRSCKEKKRVFVTMVNSLRSVWFCIKICGAWQLIQRF